MVLKIVVYACEERQPNPPVHYLADRLVGLIVERAWTSDWVIYVCLINTFYLDRLDSKSEVIISNR